MNARRGLEGFGALDAEAVENIEDFVVLKRRGGAKGLDVLIRLSRDQLTHEREIRNGADTREEKLWLGVRDFRLSEIRGKYLTGAVGQTIKGQASELLTADGFADFIRKLDPGNGSGSTVLVLWGHADGPRGVLLSRVDKNFATRRLDSRLGRDILSPADARKAMAAAMSDGSRIDIVCFDACQGACIEFASEFMHYARYLIASQTPVSGDGWNYDSWPALARGLDAANCGAVAAKIARDFDAPARDNASISVLDLSVVPSVLAALESVAAALLASKPLRTRFSSLRNKMATHDHNLSGNVDMVELFASAAQKLKTSHPDFARLSGKLAKAARAAITCSIVNKDLRKRAPLHGCSIFFPTSKSTYGPPWDLITKTVYFKSPGNLLEFKKTGWHLFIRQTRKEQHQEGLRRAKSLRARKG